jgi:RND family efflux transporter MFP subunit
VRSALILVVAFAAAVSACRRTPERESEAEPAVPVIAEPVRLGTIRGTVSATGLVTTEPGATFSVVAHQPARIAEVTKNTGDAVTAGETLVRFEFPSLRAQSAVNAAAVRAGELRLQQAQLAQNRIKALVAKGAASRSELEEADRELDAAQGELAAARAAVGVTESQGQNTIIRAPFDGIISERLHNPGDLVRADESDPILRLINPRQVHVTAALAVADASRVTVGATARAVAVTTGQVDGRSVQKNAGASSAAPTVATELLRVASRPAPEAGASSVDVTFTFDSPTELKPGTQVGIEIDAEQRLNVALIPAIAVLKDDPAHPVVMVAAGGVAVRRPVTIGLVDAENIEILSGLKPGESIITQGHLTLRDGTPISVSPP